MIDREAMPRGVKKENLPTKTCVVCNRPFTWRKKWERCWDEITTCSNRCKAERKRKKGGAGAVETAEPEGRGGVVASRATPADPLRRLATVRAARGAVRACARIL